MMYNLMTAALPLRTRFCVLTENTTLQVIIKKFLGVNEVVATVYLDQFQISPLSKLICFLLSYVRKAVSIKVSLNTYRS